MEVTSQAAIGQSQTTTKTEIDKSDGKNKQSSSPRDAQTTKVTQEKLKIPPRSPSSKSISGSLNSPNDTDDERTDFVIVFNNAGPTVSNSGKKKTANSPIRDESEVMAPLDDHSNTAYIDAIIPPKSEYTFLRRIVLPIPKLDLASSYLTLYAQKKDNSEKKNQSDTYLCYISSSIINYIDFLHDLSSPSNLCSSSSASVRKIPAKIDEYISALPISTEQDKGIVRRFKLSDKEGGEELNVSIIHSSDYPYRPGRASLVKCIINL